MSMRIMADSSSNSVVARAFANSVFPVAQQNILKAHQQHKKNKKIKKTE